MIFSSYAIKRRGIPLHPPRQLFKLFETLVPSDCGRILKLVVVECVHLTFLMRYPNYVIDESTEEFHLAQHTSNRLWDVMHSNVRQ